MELLEMLDAFWPFGLSSVAIVSVPRMETVNPESLDGSISLETSLEQDVKMKM